MAEIQVAEMPAQNDSNTEGSVVANESVKTRKPTRVRFFADYQDEELRQMESMYSGTLNELTEGEIVKGRIVHISDKDVTVDVGFKSEGIIPLIEFRDPSQLKVGDEIEVYLESIEDKMGQLILSKRKADTMRIWEKIYESPRKGHDYQWKNCSACQRRHDSLAQRRRSLFARFSN